MIATVIFGVFLFFACKYGREHMLLPLVGYLKDDRDRLVERLWPAGPYSEEEHRARAALAQAHRPHFERLGRLAMIPIHATPDELVGHEYLDGRPTLTKMAVRAMICLGWCAAAGFASLVFLAAFRHEPDLWPERVAALVFVVCSAVGPWRWLGALAMPAVALRYVLPRLRSPGEVPIQGANRAVAALYLALPLAAVAWSQASRTGHLVYVLGATVAFGLVGEAVGFALTHLLPSAVFPRRGQYVAEVKAPVHHPPELGESCSTPDGHFDLAAAARRVRRMNPVAVRAGAAAEAAVSVEARPSVRRSEAVEPAPAAPDPEKDFREVAPYRWETAFPHTADPHDPAAEEPRMVMEGGRFIIEGVFPLRPPLA